jgi:hypothetical protein
MKRTFAIIAALPIIMAGAAHAQGVGIKGGMVWNNVRDSGALPGSLSGRTGWTGGITLATGKGPVGLGLEGLYAQRGVNAPSGTDSRRLDYIDVPAYLRVEIPITGIAPYVYAGPQVSFELRCRTGDAATSCPSGRPMTTYAGIIGAGLFFGDHSGLSLEGRYMYGLSDLKLGTVTSGSSYRNRSFLILAGLHF